MAGVGRHSYAFFLHTMFLTLQATPLSKGKMNTRVSVPILRTSTCCSSKPNFCWQQWGISVLATSQGQAVQWGGIYLHGRLQNEEGRSWKILICAALGNQHVNLRVLLLLFYLISICTSIYSRAGTQSSAVSPCGTPAYWCCPVYFVNIYLILERVNRFIRRVTTDLYSVRKSHGAT